MLLLLFVQRRKNPGISPKVLEKSSNFDAKSPGKSWKVLEFESIFLGGTMYFIVAI